MIPIMERIKKEVFVETEIPTTSTRFGWFRKRYIAEWIFAVAMFVTAAIIDRTCIIFEIFFTSSETTGSFSS